MDIAHITAKLSSARRLQVGSVIVKDNKILATGYNGMPSGWDNNCEDEVIQSYASFEGAVFNTALVTKKEVLHAETNAIAKVAHSTESSQGSTLFCTHAPCIECAKLIYQAGIATVYYHNEYRDDCGIKFLRMSGVNVQQYCELQD